MKKNLLVLVCLSLLSYSSFSSAKSNYLECKVRYIAYFENTVVYKEIEGKTISSPFDFYSSDPYEGPDYGTSLRLDEYKAHFWIAVNKGYELSSDNSKRFIDSFDVYISSTFNTNAPLESRFINADGHVFEQTLRYDQAVAIGDGYSIKKAVLSCTIK